MEKMKLRPEALGSLGSYGGSIFERRQTCRRESDRLLEQHEQADDPEERRDLARAAFTAMMSVPPEADRRTTPAGRRNGGAEIVPTPGTPLSAL